MTKAEVEKLIALASAATPGKWQPTTDGFSVFAPSPSGGSLPACCAHNKKERTSEAAANAAFIAASREAVPALAKALIEAMGELHNGAEHYHPWRKNVIPGCRKCALLDEWEGKR